MKSIKPCLSAIYRNCLTFAILSTFFALMLCISPALCAERDANLNSVLNWVPAETEAITSLTTHGFDDSDLSPLNPGAGWLVYMMRPFWPVCDDMGKPKTIECIECIAASTDSKQNELYCCDFLFFGDNLDDNVKLSTFLSKNASNKYDECGLTVIQLPDLAHRNNASSYRFCLVRPGLLVGSTSKEGMHTALSRMSAAVPARVALPDSIAEWSLVNTASSCWGFRHFSTSAHQSAKEKSSAADKDDIEKSKRDSVLKQAEGLAFNYDFTNKVVNFTYVSKSKSIKEDAETICGITNKNQDLIVSTKQSTKGSISLDLKTSNNHAPHECLTAILSNFGWEPKKL